MAQDKSSINFINFESSFNEIENKEKQQEFIQHLINLHEDQLELVMAKQCTPFEDKKKNIDALVEAVFDHMERARSNNNSVLQDKCEKLLSILPSLFNSKDIHNPLDKINHCYTQSYQDIKDNAAMNKKDFFGFLFGFKGKFNVINEQYQKSSDNITQMLVDIENPDILSANDLGMIAKKNELIKDLKIVLETPELLTKNYNSFSSEQEKEKSQFLKGILNLDNNEFKVLLEKQYKADPKNIENIITALDPDKEIFLSVKEKKKNYIREAKEFLVIKNEINKGIELFREHAYSNLSDENKEKAAHALHSLKPQEDIEQTEIIATIKEILKDQPANDLEALSNKIELLYDNEVSIISTTLQDLIENNESKENKSNESPFITSSDDGMEPDPKEENSSNLPEEVKDNLKVAFVKGMIELVEKTAKFLRLNPKFSNESTETERVGSGKKSEGRPSLSSDNSEININHQTLYLENLIQKLEDNKNKMRGKLANKLHIDTGGIKELKNILEKNGVDTQFKVNDPYNLVKIKAAFAQITDVINKKAEKYSNQDNEKISQHKASRKDFYDDQKSEINTLTLNKR